ncbi:hypothetical protein O181_126015 [Austropuccinia psidii MF-1]|uniref:Uncharacterized protein n=1 Tax=Austropuccinia psidii MF-1 TaxID=1389203 RepID=A0A9Q3KVW1_9BASI|nr:hypothetical protein [Austropuccinia psidii MF-1]
MTLTRSGSNYSIQSNGSGPGHSSHKSKGQDCQLIGEAQMEDARASTSSQRLASTFETFIKSPEAEKTAIPVVRPESFPTGNKRNMTVSIQELVYGGKEAGVGASYQCLDRHNELISSSEEVNGHKKTEELLWGWKRMYCKGQVHQIKAWLKKQSMLSEDQKKKLAQGKDNSPVEAPQASTSKNTPQKVANKGNKTPKNNQKGKKKEKG